MTQRIFPPPSDRDQRVPSDVDAPGSLEVVWGVPSDEMLESEQAGQIILVHDLTRSFPPRLLE
jgi:hypothetical protein